MKKIAFAFVVLLAITANADAFGHRKAARQANGCAGVASGACSGVSGCSGVAVTKTYSYGCHGTAPKALPKEKPTPPQAPPTAAAPHQVIYIQAAPVRLFGRRGGCASCQ